MKRVNKKLMAVVLGFAIIGSLSLARMVYSQSRKENKTRRVSIQKLDFKKARKEPGILAVPLKLNYQGYLTDNGGTPVTDTVTMIFKIYDAEIGGAQQWSSGNQSISVENGIFHYILNNVPLSVFSDGAFRWLELTVNSEILSPRTEITSVPWAYYATVSDSTGTGGADSNWTLSGNVLHPSGNYGLSMRQSNVLYGNNDSTHINFGIACTTGTFGPNNKYCTVSGGYENVSSAEYATVCGGSGNTASGGSATIGGGDVNKASGGDATVGGGGINTASGSFATVSGGMSNSATYDYATVSGGVLNTASSWCATVGGGEINVSGGGYATVSGGYYNKANSYCATVGGGNNNTADSSDYATVCGGMDNTACGEWSTVGGGLNNTSSAFATTIAGGSFNNASGDNATIGGGMFNIAIATEATVGGGSGNVANGDYTTVSGGWHNNASGTRATVGGGESNVASGQCATVSGGEQDSATGNYATIGGGYYNTASGQYTTIAGGYDNRVSGWCSTISGGEFNRADSLTHATVGGGMMNNASGSTATVSGGWSNIASGTAATVSGGGSNTASETKTTVGGGESNTASGQYATVGGGGLNTASGQNSSVSGGEWNFSSGNYASVGGGRNNIAGGDYSVIPGGNLDSITANGNYSMAFGVHVLINSPNRVVFFNSDYPGYFGINRDDNDGGILHPIHVGTDGTNGNGAHLTVGGNWTNGSSRKFKEDFEELSGGEILDKIQLIDVKRWKYKETDEYHIGPVAEDFYDIFEVGTDSRYLASSDVGGVALRAIQELTALLEVQQETNQNQQKEIERLTQEIEELKSGK